MTRITIVDHGAGNLVSIAQGLRRAGAETLVTDTARGFAGADAVVLPGVGSTGAAMSRLAGSGLDAAVRSWEGPLLGICVGLQLFYDESEEAETPALGLLAGSVKRLRADRLPHMGWNDVSLAPDPIFAGIPDGTPFYFVHSYAPEPEDPGSVIGTTDYGGQRIVAAVRSGRLVGVQFHPERSGALGEKVLANFVRSVTKANRAA